MLPKVEHLEDRFSHGEAPMSFQPDNALLKASRSKYHIIREEKRMNMHCMENG